jgi:hypothetical protein
LKTEIEKAKEPSVKESAKEPAKNAPAAAVKDPRAKP